MIKYAKQEIDKSDVSSVIKALKSELITQGNFTIEFEKRISQLCEVKYAVSINSATSALHLACLSLNLKKGDCVWTSANSFVASANCALYCGAEVDFIDVDQKTYNISIDALTKKLITAKLNKKLPKILIAVHFAGQPSEMKELRKLSKLYNFKIIEDASHAIGAKYLNSYIGSCKYSDITIFSFHPVKIITTGEGGMLLTKNKKIYEMAKLLRSHGINREIKKNKDLLFYNQKMLGYNYRMTEIQAALGISQLKKINSFLEKRHMIAKIYNKSLNKDIYTIPFQKKGTYSSFHLYPILINFNRIKFTKNQLISFLHKNGVQVSNHYIPIYLHSYHNNKKYKNDYCPNAFFYYKNSISLPMYASLSLKDQNKVIKLLNSVEKNK